MSAAPVDKMALREARQLLEAAAASRAAGDNAHSRSLLLRVERLAPDTDLGRSAAHSRSQIALDVRAVYFGLGSLLVYALAWLWALA